MRRQLIVTGGWAHPFERTVHALSEALAPLALETTIAFDPDAAGAAFDAGQFDLVTVYACWFQMHDERYDAVRVEWARDTPSSLRRGLSSHVDAGGGLLALHTAPICFDDWPGWAGIVGGRWDWSRSWHPAPAELEVRTDDRHPVVAGHPAFRVVDERYTDLEVSADAHVVAWTVDADGEQPAAWLHRPGGARVVYDSLGHDERSIGQPDHAAILRQAAAWALGD